MKATVIVAAAGRGQRMKEQVNKQYLPLAGKPVLYYSLAACLASGCFEQVVVVVTPGEEELLRRDVLLPYFPDANIYVVTGGKERQDSVWAGLLAVSAGSDFVCVHDGARPLATPELFNLSLETATRLGTAVAAVPVKDTIKRVDEFRKVVETPPRKNLWAVQTPQTFRRDWFEDAYKRARHDDFYATDDAALLEHYGYSVHIFQSEYSNLKVTTPEDLVLAESLLGRKPMRIGTGFDVHRLVEDRQLIVGGVTIPYSLGLLGHSDADVLLHAIMDAMLGALALGDIGKHFPDTDPRYKGISSLGLLIEVNGLCNREGYTVGNVDTIIIAEKPKFAPYIDEMRANISRTLNITADRVAVKATTTEGLGFCGRGEGIAAQASVILTRGQA